ncbi:Cellobiose 2-epimerase [subsurface metagenome]
MKLTEIENYITIYRDGLLNDTLPFWIEHSIDEEFGGFLFSCDRDGTIIDTDKGLWQTSRFTWMLGTLYNQVKKKKDWLVLAKHGIDFIDKYGFDKDGRMFFHLTRKGKPIRKRRYLFSETFAAIAYAAYAKATDEEKYINRAREIFDLIIKYSSTSGLLPPKFTDTRPVKGLSFPMILIVTAQELRKNLDDNSYTKWIDQSIEEIEKDFMKPKHKVVMETVSKNGEILNHFDGRMLNPGHAIEAAWFIMQEAKYRNNDPELVRMGTTILDWMWEWGWDKKFGGIIYFRDLKGYPVQEYWHDMKFWWPQNEAIIATLMAYQLTGEKKYAEWHKMIHEWTYKIFPDPEYGEWFGYFHRDGRLSVPLKGNLWKGPFHIPRMQLMAWKILEEIKSFLAV